MSRRIGFVALVAVFGTLVFPAWGAVDNDPGGEAREIVLAMIAAHGGMEKWKAAPTISFEDRVFMGDGKPGVPSRVTVEQGPRRAYIDFPGTEMRLSWDGERAWSENWDSPYPPRFLAQLNYYFLNLPWLTMDPGVILEFQGTGQLWDDPVEYQMVKMTFETGIGDTPDDYYFLYIDPESHLLKANRYIVTYSSLLGEGQKSTPEHILVYEEIAEVGGLRVPARYTIYDTDRKVLMKCSVGDWSFSRPFDLTRMNMPEGATVDNSND